MFLATRLFVVRKRKHLPAIIVCHSQHSMPETAHFTLRFHIWTVDTRSINEMGHFAELDKGKKLFCILELNLNYGKSPVFHSPTCMHCRPTKLNELRWCNLDWNGCRIRLLAQFRSVDKRSEAFVAVKQMNHPQSSKTPALHRLQTNYSQFLELKPAELILPLVIEADFVTSCVIHWPNCMNSKLYVKWGRSTSAKRTLDMVRGLLRRDDPSEA